MSTVSLHTLEGYRPLGRVGNTDKYLLEKGGEYVSASAMLGNLVIGPRDIEEIARRERQEIQAEQGFAPYVGDLAEHLRSTGRDFVSCEHLAYTALTNLFCEQYGVAIDDLTNNTSDALRVVAAPYSPAMGEGWGLGYQIHQGRSAETFWQIDINARYGFVNMHCVSTTLATPLEGQGNIAYMPGVEQALAADVQMLVETARQS